MDHGLLDILTCPSCKSELTFSQKQQLLVCRADRLAFEIRNDKPIMLVEQATNLTAEQVSQLLTNK